MRPPLRLRWGGAWLLLAGALGCGGDTTVPRPPSRAVSIVLTTKPAFAEIGVPLTLSVVARDSNGTVVPDPPVGWSSSSDSILTVANGVVQGVTPFVSARVTARLSTNGASDVAELRVTPRFGDYDVSTTMTRFQFETAAPSPPDCPNYTMYCTHSREFAGATLRGVLHVGTEGITGSFDGTFCDAWNAGAVGGCTHVAAVPTASYVLADQGYWHGHDPVLREAVYSFLPRMIYLSGAYSADSVYGSVAWIAYYTRSPPSHFGTFVARRRPGS